MDNLTKEQQVSRILYNMGIKKHMKGYPYLLKMIMLTYDGASLESIYSTLSFQFSTDIQSVQNQLTLLLQKTNNFKNSLAETIELIIKQL